MQMLSHLVNRTTNSRLLIVATHRTTAPDRTDELTMSIAELYALPGVTRIDLPGLNADDIARYVADASGISTDEARRPAAILRDHTGGNPFFLEEVWRDLDAQGGVRRFAELTLEAPPSVRDMLEVRIRGLPASALEVLERAAVAGDSTDIDLLASADRDIDDVLDALDSGVAFGLLSDTDGQRFVFRHSLTRQAVVARIPRRRRLQLHAQAALALERQRRHTPEVVAALAHHFTRASSLGYSEQATRYLAASGAAARASLAHNEAARAYQRASEMANGSVEMLFESAKSLRDAGRLVEARRLYQDLCDSNDPVRYARAAIGFEMSAWPQNAQPDVAVLLLTTALERLDPESSWHIRAMVSLGRALQVAGAIDIARDIGEDALRRARQTGDEDLIAHALIGLIHHMWEPHEMPRLVDLSDELLPLAHKSGKMMQIAMAYGAGLNARYRLGDADAYEAGLTSVVWAVEVSGQPLVALSGACMLISDAYRSGRFARRPGSRRETAR